MLRMPEVAPAIPTRLSCALMKAVGIRKRAGLVQLYVYDQRFSVGPPISPQR